MNHCATVSLPALACLLAACGGGGSPKALLASKDGRYRVVHAYEAQWKQDRARAEMASVLDRNIQIDLVYGHNDPMALGARLACEQRGRKGIKFIGIDALPSEGRKAVADGLLDASIEYPTCGAAAVDLALLAIEGVKLEPKDIKVGTRVWTRANVQNGGELKAGPGDLALAQLRQTHADKLTRTPKTDQHWKIGMSQCTDDEPWRLTMNADIEKRVAEYPQLRLVLKKANDDTEKQRTHVRELIQEGCNAILVSPKESMALVKPCQEALAKGIPVIVLDRELGSDDYTCFVGGDNLFNGKAVGVVIGELLPDGGNIVELQGLMTSSPAQQRHEGFVQQLLLQKAQ